MKNIGVFMNGTTFSCAVIGCGSVAVMHCHGIIEAGHTLAALCDIKAEKAQKYKEQFAPDARIYTDWQEMLLCPDIDVVHICTPHYLHVDMAVAALKAGKHVFLEKPLATNEADIQRLLRAEAESDKYICVCFQNRFLPAMQYLKGLVEQYGPVTSARGMVTWKRTAPYYTDSGWRGKWDTEGGGVMINQAIHNLDLLLWLCGVPSHVEASCANRHLQGVIEVEDTCEARLTYDDGRVALFYATTAHGEDAPNFLELACPAHRIMLYGETIMVDGVISPCDEPEIVTSLGKKCWGNGHIHLISLFYQSILDGEPSPVSVESASHAVKVLLQCYESSGIKER